jgi:excisionase family DNA binding protein
MRTITEPRQSIGKLISIETAAELLAVSQSAIRSWIAKGLLTKLKVGTCVRVREVEVLALIKPQEIGPADVSRPARGGLRTAAPTSKKGNDNA